MNSPIVRHCQLESRMRENRLYGSEGGGAARRSPYPYPLTQSSGMGKMSAARGRGRRRG